MLLKDSTIEMPGTKILENEMCVPKTHKCLIYNTQNDMIALSDIIIVSKVKTLGADVHGEIKKDVWRVANCYALMRVT